MSAGSAPPASPPPEKKERKKKKKKRRNKKRKKKKERKERKKNLTLIRCRRQRDVSGQRSAVFAAAQAGRTVGHRNCVHRHTLRLTDGLEVSLEEENYVLILWEGEEEEQSRPPSQAAPHRQPRSKPGKGESCVNPMGGGRGMASVGAT